MSATSPDRMGSTRTGARSTRDYTPTRRVSTETKASFKTTEFFAMLAVIAGILISAASISGGGSHTDIFTATRAWLYVSIVASAYMISRGLAKSGSREPYDEDR